VLALLAIGFALALPALAKVRVAAARAQSTNNLKQIAIAAFSYHDTYQFFPPGCDANNFSASAYLLPYIEQDAVFKAIDFKKSVDDKANAEARKTQIRTFLNPMDAATQSNPDFGATNYLFNAGAKPDLKDDDGVYYLESKTKVVDITDGTSNTLMAVETLKGDGGDKAVDVRRQYVLLKEGALKGIKDDAGPAFWKEGQNIAGDRCASWMDGRFLQGTFNTRLKINDERPDVSLRRPGRRVFHALRPGRRQRGDVRRQRAVRLKRHHHPDVARHLDAGRRRHPRHGFLNRRRP